MKRTLTAIAAAIVASIAVAQTSLAQPKPGDDMDLPPSVTVSGVGQVFSRPDMATLQVGVVTQAATATDALNSNNKAMEALMQTLQAKGVLDKDILTSNFSVFPEYRQDQPRPDGTYEGGAEPNSGGSKMPTIIGYRVNNDVQIRVRKLGDLGGVLDALVRSGANNVNSVTFSVAEPAPILDQARKKAVDDARRKAELYATAAGIKIGRVLYIDERVGVTPPRPLMMAREMAADSGQAVPIATGEQEMSATVTITYAIQ
jgi:uncharacterized protein